MRILLLMQWFDPEPQIKGLVFAKKLRDLGHDVEVLTGFPNYPEGKIYPGYSLKLFLVESMDGIRVTRVPLYPSHDTSALRRVLNYVSFGVSSFVAGLFLLRRNAVIYACGPPVTVGVGAALIGFLRRAPFVYDIQDLWPDSLGATGMFDSKLGSRVVAAICNWVYSRAAQITVQSPGVRDRLVARGVDAQKIAVIFNWCDEASIDVSPRMAQNADAGSSAAPRRETFDVLFAGNIGKAQDLDAVLEAARRLQEDRCSIRVLLLGGGIEVPRLKQLAASCRIANVIFLPRVPMAEVGPILAAADVLLVHLKDDPLFRITIPAKTQAYLAAGKPVLMAVAGDAAQLIRESGAGVCAEPSNAVSIAEAIRQLASLSPERLREMGERGRTFYRQELSLDAGVEHFQQVFQRAATIHGFA